MSPKLKILCFISYYYPGYKAGGPLRTIVNMVEQLSDEFEFWIVTRDRDLGDASPYENVLLNQWVDIDKAKVFYATPENLTFWNLLRLSRQTPCDVLYLNSFFDIDFTIKLLLGRKLGMFKKIPVIVAPRGEFSLGALLIKPLKKKIFMKAASWLGLYNGVVWQASTKFEKEDILKNVETDLKRVIIAIDLPSKNSTAIIEQKNIKKNGSLKVVFLSRISPMKNLDYALKVLQNVQYPVCFDIYGPVEDLEYWSLCKELIKKMPNNVVVNYHGSVKPEEVSTIFSSQDLFFFPTRGENYGHVIAESLLVGTPVLLSDQTPWRNLEKDSLGLDLSLSDNNGFADAIEYYCNLKVEERVKLREKIQINAYERIFNAKDIEANKELFLFAINDFNVK